jgi:soluble lytic murein transglycosylase-like protein
MKSLLVIAATVVMLNANAFCFEQAGREYNINPALLAAIAQVESSMRHDVLNESHYERTKSIDIGLMQINSGALKQLAKEGITKEILLRDPCTNVRVGARILAEKFKKEGPGWEGVGAYNASCVQLKGEACRQARAAYTNKVWRAMNGQLGLRSAKSKSDVKSAQPQIASEVMNRSETRIASIEIASLEIIKNNE